MKNTETLQSKQYSKEELTKLKEFIKIVKNNNTRAAFAGWGNHHDYTHGY